MKLLFEQSAGGRGCDILWKCDVPAVQHKGMEREKKLNLPQMSEIDISRHYTKLAENTYGVNTGFYPLGSCTMKYNPKVNEDIAALPGFTEIHPLQPVETIQGCLKVLKLAEKIFCEITGMDGMSFQPAAGAHGEFTGLLLIKAYHEKRGDIKRTKMIVPDSAHGTNPASAAMAGYTIVNIPSMEDGCVDMEQLKAAVGEDTAGLMLTNPNTAGLFDKNILEITRIVHEAGGLNYYDGANLNAVMGIVRPGDMGFDIVHLNLHKTFATPHGGGGPGSGPCGCMEFLMPYLPGPRVCQNSHSTDQNTLISGMDDSGFELHLMESPESIGMVKEFYGNFQVVVRALSYILTLGREGIKEASQAAVLNANYMMHRLKGHYEMAYGGPCMHEFVMSLAKMKQETGVTAMDAAKSMLDYRLHPPTMYFPLIVPEALMVEPTETESRETLDDAVDILLKIYREAYENPQKLHQSPGSTIIGRPDEVKAARKPKLRYIPENESGWQN